MDNHIFEGVTHSASSFDDSPTKLYRFLDDPEKENNNNTTYVEPPRCEAHGTRR